MSVSYETVLKPVITEIEISRSRFITRLERVETEDEAREIIADVRAEHPKARHHCTAFIIGSESEIRRSNDDGEPSGTAGAPMLEALGAAGLSDVVAVVTRYFGGILLGAGGLTRAYRAAVAEATAAAVRVKRQMMQTFYVTSGYDFAPQIESWVRREGFAVVSADYGANVRLGVGVPPKMKDRLVAEIAELSGGQALVESGDTGFVDV